MTDSKNLWCISTLLIGHLLLAAGCRNRESQAKKIISPIIAAPTAPSVTTGPSPAATLTPRSFACEQEGLLEEFGKSSNEPFRQRSAYLLSELWRDGLLKEKIREQLVRENYHVVLFQIPGNYNAPNFEVRGQQTFPFPEIWTEFTPALYRNDKVEWSPNQPQKAHAMSQNNSTLTSRIGGEIKNGDVLQYRIDIEQMDRSEGSAASSATTNHLRRWRMSLWTNKLVVQGLDEPRARAD